MYKVNLIDSASRKLLLYYESSIVPEVRDMITLKEGRVFVVGARMLPSTDTKEIACLGQIAQEKLVRPQESADSADSADSAESAEEEMKENKAEVEESNKKSVFDTKADVGSAKKKENG